MPKVKMTYVQYRLSADQSVAVPEKKEEYFENSSYAGIIRTVLEFLDEGSVVCGGKTYSRSLISVEEVLPLPPVLQPKPEFIPDDGDSELNEFYSYR